MFEGGNITEDNNVSSFKKRSNLTVILLSRWVALVFVVLFSIEVSDSALIPGTFPYLLTAAVLYNTIITYRSANKRQSSPIFSLYTVYIDAVAVSLFAYHLGGVESDIFILYLLLTGYCGMITKSMSALGFGMFCVVAYSIACISSPKQLMGMFDYIKLITRDCFIMFGALGFTRIFHAIKRYNELRKKDFMIARTDKLTGLANRHYFDSKIKEDVHYSDYTGNVLNVLMFDLDNFKGFNDTYGHVWGDKLLGLFSDIIRQNIRQNDIPVRYGGEEFVILIRDLDIVLVKSIGDRIRKQLEKQRLYAGTGEEKIRITVSCGVAQYPKHGRTIKEVIDNADKALYYAKSNGKNTVVVYDEIEQNVESEHE